MKCKCFKEVEKKLIELIGLIKNTHSEVCEEKGPYVDPKDIRCVVKDGFFI